MTEEDDTERTRTERMERTENNIFKGDQKLKLKKKVEKK
jgi:hypothetical protein